MKKIIYIAFAALAFAAVSCSKNAELTIDPALSDGITLTFTCSEAATRADVDGTDNENRVNRIDYFIFPVGEDGKVADDTEYAYKNSYTPASGQETVGTYTVTIQPGVLGQIFPNGAQKAMVFAIANYVDKFGAAGNQAGTGPALEEPNTTLPEDATTWKALHELEVGPTFFKDGASNEYDYFGLRWPRVMQPDEDALFFVMTGEAEIELKTSGNYAVQGEVPLERLASKVTVTFTYENYVEKKNGKIITWVPEVGDRVTKIYLSNGIEHTTLGGPLTRDLVGDSWGTATQPEPGGNGTRDVFEYAYDYMNEITTVDEDGNKIAHYYTYPVSLEEGDDNQPYLKLVLPWHGYKYIGTEENPTFDPESTTFDEEWTMYKEKEVYYKIVLPRETITEPNKIYEYAVKVNIIGSDREVKIIGEQYIVKDWLTKLPVSSNVATGRYISLDIPKDEYDMYVDEIDITFVSSGTVIPIIEEIYQLNYSEATASRDYFMQDDAVVADNDLRDDKGIPRGDAGDEVIRGWVTIPEGTSYLKINHPLDNRLLIDNEKNDAFDMAPYVYVVTLHLEAAGDDTSFDRTITITQYPSLYVTSITSNGYAFVNNYSNVGDGSRICYDNRGSNNNDARLGNFANQQGSLTGSGNNSNPNNYIITTSILSGYDYIIGDPRSKTVDNLSYLSLTNYYPTEPSGTENTISPKFMVASSYGAVNSTYYFNLETARKRCAAYQENGYPAGRWRIPTAAEIKFMVTLSTFGFIPSLYTFSANDRVGYWSANGKVVGNNQGVPTLDTSSTSNTAVRCVYDVWYWGEDPYQEGATDWLGFQDK